MRRAVGLLLVVTLVGCPRPPPPAPPPPLPRPDVPEGCLDSFEGEWVHAEDSSFRYFAADDGGTLTLSVRHLVPRDAGFVPRRFLPPKDAGTPDAGAPPRLDARDAGAVPDGGRLDGGSTDAGVATPTDGGEPTKDAGAVLEPSAPPFEGPFVTLERTTHGFVGHTEAVVMHPSGRECRLTFHTEVLSCRDGGLLLRSEAQAAVGELCQAPAHQEPTPALVHQLIRPPVDAGP